MLKNGTLLKVSPELIQALKNALDLRYLPLIQQARRQRRSLITDDVEASAEYNGMFKVIWDNEVDDEGNVTKRRVKVINGADPESGIAGVTDIVSDVMVTAVDAPESGRLLMCGRYKEETGYYITFTFSPDFPDKEQYGYYVLAEIRDNAMAQVWTGGAVYFGERYYI